MDCTDMQIRALVFVAATLLANGALAQSAPLQGRIKSFECGDNCYLTVVDARGREVTGLCVARACRPWNERTQIPRSLIGKTVQYTTGVGVQRDGAGNVMGRMTSFRTIEILN